MTLTATVGFLARAAAPWYSALFVLTTVGVPIPVSATVSDAERNLSMEMNASSYSSSTQDGDVKVAFVGNSITLHGPAPQIGWTNNWGMAASCRERDYVHLVALGIERMTGRKVRLLIRSLVEFERNFKDYDLSKTDDLVDFEPEYLIVALGENVPALKTEGERAEFQKAFATLLRRFVERKNRPHVVVRGVFWPNQWKDACMKQAAESCSATFVRADFGDRAGMKALGLYSHKGVANHPSDDGMAAMAKAVLKGFSPRP